uniref:Retrotransposon gag domain-containing protein n=1 Tax=Astatotilapia calliptera TaxID=8154 RepID=A0AAX7UZA9_ASTCA
ALCVAPLVPICPASHASTGVCSWLPTSLSSLSRQLAASEQWAGRVNETLSAIQETLARLVPPTAPAVPAPPPVPSASLSVGSVRDPAPPALVPFTGELGRCGGFLIQVSLLFQRYPQAFSNDAVKISHVIGALRDRALDWAESYLALHPVETVTYVQFVRDFKAVFHHPLRSDEAARQLHGLRQGGRSVAEFSIDFRVKAAETGWGEDAHCLSHCLQSALPPSPVCSSELAPE